MVRGALLMLVALIGQPAPAEKKDTPVAINILVIEANAKPGAVDDKLKHLMPSMRGYKAATVRDELNTKVEEGSSVSLQISVGPSRMMMKVNVVRADPDGTVKLRIEVPDLKFFTDTTHPKGKPIVVGHPLGDEKALFLSVTPKT